MNDIKMMIFLLLSRLWWGALLSPLRKTTNGSQSCLFPFACVGTMLVPSVGLPPGGQRGAAPSCKFPWAKGTGCLSHCSNEPLSWKHSQVGKPQLCQDCTGGVLPGQDRGCSSACVSSVVYTPQHLSTHHDTHHHHQHSLTHPVSEERQGEETTGEETRGEETAAIVWTNTIVLSSLRAIRPFWCCHVGFCPAVSLNGHNYSDITWSWLGMSLCSKV